MEATRPEESRSARAYRAIAGAIAAELSVLSVTRSDVLNEFDYTWDTLPRAVG